MICAHFLNAIDPYFNASSRRAAVVGSSGRQQWYALSDRMRSDMAVGLSGCLPGLSGLSGLSDRLS
eukprot:900983-Prymnesium_polylepis.1